MRLLLSALLFNAVGVVFADTYTIVAEDDWYPYSAARNNQAEGLAVDVVKAAFAAAGAGVQLKLLPYARCMDEVKKGNEIGCFDTNNSDPNYQADFVYHKEPLFIGRIAVYAPAAFSGTVDVKGLEGHSVGVTIGYSYGVAVDSNTKIKKQPAETDIQNLMKLAAGRVEFALLYDKVADTLVAENKDKFAGKFKAVGVVSEDGLYISFSKIHPKAAEAMAAFNKGMSTIRSNGTYKKIEDDWNAKLK